MFLGFHFAFGGSVVVVVFEEAASQPFAGDADVALLVDVGAVFGLLFVAEFFDGFAFFLSVEFVLEGVFACDGDLIFFGCHVSVSPPIRGVVCFSVVGCMVT